MTKIEHAEQWLAGTVPVIWRNGDVLSMEEVHRLANFPQLNMAKLFDAGDVPHNFAISGVTCEDCGHVFTMHGLSKTRVLQAVHQAGAEKRERNRSRYKRIDLLCSACIIGRKQNEREQNARSAANWGAQMDRDAENYIRQFVDPCNAWATAKKEWFRTIDVHPMMIRWAPIAAAIKALPYSEFLCTPYWKAVAQQVKFKAHFRCQMCNEDGELHVHHRSYEKHGYEHMNLQDLICVCATCHSHHHGIES